MPSTPTKALTPTRVSSPPSSTSSLSSTSSTPSAASSPSRFGGLTTPTRLSLSPNSNSSKIRSSLDNERRSLRGTTTTTNRGGILAFKDYLCCGSGNRLKNINHKKDHNNREQFFWVFVQHAAFILLATGLIYAMSVQRDRINAQLDLDILLGSVKSSILLRNTATTTSAASSSNGGVFCGTTNSGGVVVACNNETTTTTTTTLPTSTSIKSMASSSTTLNPLLRGGGGGTIIRGPQNEGIIKNIFDDSTFLKFDFDSAKREERFPSVEDRVKLYMSDWYVVPCQQHHAAAAVAAALGADSPMVRYHYVVDKGNVNNNHENDDDNSNNNATAATRSLLIIQGVDSSGNPIRLQIDSSIESDRLFYLEPSRLPACYEDPNNAARVYCRDVSDTLVPLLTHKDSNKNNNNNPHTPPLLFQFGDKLASRDFGYVQIPHIRKFRRAIRRSVLAEITAPTCHDKASSRTRRRRPAAAASPASSSSTSSLVRDDDNDDTPFQGILWKLNTKRHFGDIVKVQRSDVPWSKKKNKAIFWGGPNQPDQDDSFNNNNNNNNSTATAAAAPLTDSEKCHAMPRCRFVLMYANSTLVEAKLSKTRDIFANNVIDGVAVTTPQGRKSVTEVIKYKGIIMLEGNDVASGLKWSLYSNSVVLMPPPTFTSFAMEELLVPFVHYVPLRSDLSDAQEQMQWILDNDVAAQKIAQAGKQWVHDLLFHPDAARDNELVNREILKRYRMHFQQQDTSSPFTRVLW